MILVVADHASAHVPDDIDLGIDPALLATHIAVDIGVADVAAAWGWPAHLGEVSRLVVDCNRDGHEPAAIPIASDGHAIPGNALSHDAREARLARWFAPYHARLAERVAAERPALIVSLHSFTPRLESDPAPRPWEVGVLYNRDDRAARLALPMLAAASIVVGDQQPYSGRLLNATMNRHAEANGIAYLGLEVRQDLIGTPAGAARWAERLRPVIEAVHDAFIG